eukprot:scaffold618273_cov37-Prasinocladus_malaysianus.AAC.1
MAFWTNSFTSNKLPSGYQPFASATWLKMSLDGNVSNNSLMVFNWRYDSCCPVPNLLGCSPALSRQIS